MLEEKFYTVADVASVTGMTSRTIRNYLKDGTLTGTKIGVQWRFTEDDIKRLFHRESFVSQTPSQQVKAVMADTSPAEERICAILDIPSVTLAQGMELFEAIRNRLSDKEPLLTYEYFDESSTFRLVISGDVETVLLAVSMTKDKP